MKNVMVFGAFDGVHEGHRYFLQRAKSLGARLIVVVARDSTIKKLKGRRPRFSLAARMAFVKKEGIAKRVVAGDRAEGSWNILALHRPHIIALGYDQQELRNALETRKVLVRPFPKLVAIRAYRPHHYHSSILLGRKFSKSV